MFDVGMVLEGGGMRGIFTAGVLDLLLDEDIFPKVIYGVSAGACHACSYLSRQRGRAMRTVVDFANDRRYASTHSFLTTGDFFGVDFVYNQVPNKLLPFDYATYKKHPSKLYAVMTDCATGQAEYRHIADMKADIAAIQASSSLPLLSRMVKVDGKRYLDGGVSDSIPLAKSIADGFSKNIVVLTQHNGFQKEPTSMMPLVKARYWRHPLLVDSMRTRHLRYNEALALVGREEEAGNAFVIQPDAPLGIDRLEKDMEKLKATYQAGYDQAKKKLEALREFLAKNCQPVG